jgi:phage-related protein
MTYPTHPDIYFSQESPGQDVKHTFKESLFGGNYRQRVVDSINSKTESWNLSLDKQSVATVKVLTDFLDGRNGLPFYWTAPRDTSPKLWTTDGFNRGQLAGTSETLTVVYTRWFGADDS